MKLNRKVLTLPLIFLAAVLLTFLYIQNIYLPVKIQEVMIRKSDELLDRTLSVGRIDYSIFKGFVLRNIRLSEKNAPDTEFVTVEEISFQILLPAILKSHKIIIPSIAVKKPLCMIIRSEDKSFNFSDIIEKAKIQTQDSTAPLLLGKLALTDGQVQFTDHKDGNDFNREVRKINLKANLSAKGSIDFSLNGEIRQDTPPFPAFSAEGKYLLRDKKWNVKLRLKDFPSGYSRIMFPPEQVEKFEFTVKESALSMTVSDTELTGAGSMQLNGPEYRFADPNKALFAKNLKLSHFQFRKKETGWRITAEGSAEEAYYKSEEKKFQHFNILTSNLNFEREKTGIKIGGDLQLGKLDVNMAANLQGALSVRNLAASIDENGTDLTAALSSEEISIAYRDIRYKGPLASPRTRVFFKDDYFTLAGEFESNDARLDLNEKVAASGPLAAQISVGSGKDSRTALKGEMVFRKTSIKGLPLLDDITGVRGTMDFTGDTVTSPQLTFDALGATFTVSGSARNFQDTQANIRFASENVDLEQMAPIFSAFKKDLDLSVSGSASIEGRFRGKLSSPGDGDMTIKSVLKGAALESPSIPVPVDNISGTLTAERDQLQFENMKGTVNNTEYTINGMLHGFDSPSLDIALASAQLNLTSKFRLTGEPAARTVVIDSLRGYYLNTPLSAVGKVVLNPDGADMDIEGRADVQLKDLAVLLPQWSVPIKAVNPNGLLRSRFQIRGPADDWSAREIGIESESPRIELWGLKFTAPRFQLTQSGGKIKKCHFNSGLYGGELDVSASADLNDPDLRLNAALSIENTDLEKLKNDTELKNRPLSGRVYSQLEMEGNLLDGTGIMGEGTLSVENGNLAQMSIFRGLINAILPAAFRNVTFTDGTMGFEIAERKISTRNLTLTSDQVTLAGHGWIDFDQNISFFIEPKFSEIALAETKSLTKPVASVLHVANQFMDMEVSGTLSKPVFKPKPRPGKLLDKAKDILIDGLESIF